MDDNSDGWKNNPHGGNDKVFSPSKHMASTVLNIRDILFPPQNGLVQPRLPQWYLEIHCSEILNFPKLKLISLYCKNGSDWLTLDESDFHCNKVHADDNTDMTKRMGQQLDFKWVNRSFRLKMLQKQS